jgi:hypothetical protein
VIVAKKFFYLCGGILMLAVAYHFGATSAGAHASSNPIVGVAGGGNTFLVVTANGDSYLTSQSGNSWLLRDNAFGSGTPARATSFGALKVRYR